MPTNFWEDDAMPAQPKSTGSFWEDDAHPQQQERLPEEKDFLMDKLEGARGFVSHIGKDAPVLGPLATKAGNAIAAAGVKATDFFTGQDHGAYGDVYDKVTKQGEAEDRQFVKDHPVAAFGSAVTAGSMVPIPGSNFAKIIPGAGKIANIARGAFGIGEKVAPQAALSYADTAVRTGNPQLAEESAANTAKWGVGLQLLPKVVGAIGRGTARGFTGIKGETIDKYRARSPEINALSEENAILELEDAAKTVGRHGENMAGEATRGAELARERGLSEADEIMRGVADQIKEDIPKARRAVSQGSGEAFDVLNNSDQRIPLNYIKGSITQRLDALKIGKALDTSSPEVRELVNFREFLDEIGQKDLSPTDMKRLLQHLDTKIEDSYSKLQGGQRLNSGDKALMATRAGIDSNLKDPAKGIPGYAEAMTPVARKTRALNDLSEEIGYGGDDTYRKLKNINTPAAKDKAAKLARFEEEFGGDYTKKLQGSEELRAKDYKKDFEPKIAEGENLRRLGGTFSEARSQGILKRFGNNPNNNYDLGRKLDTLAAEYKKLNPDAPFNPRQMADDLAVKRAFNTTHSEGSRNVNLGAFSVAGIAKAIGLSLEKVPVLGGIGALLGAAADRGGPQAVKAVLDAIDHPNGRAAATLFNKLIKDNAVGVTRGAQRLSEESP
jgi:hypothetical protein